VTAAITFPARLVVAVCAVVVILLAAPVLWMLRVR
jgi:hypothetical protein